MHTQRASEVQPVITIQSAMLTALGFLVAALLACFILPAYRKRVERLVTTRIRQSMPVTEAEIRADRDRLRAEYAIRIHELSTKVERANLLAARQKVEISRREAAISALEVDKARLASAIDEHENARRVLEHTVTDRLPMLEGRLAEAKRVLGEREEAMRHLTDSTAQQGAVIEEATHRHIRLQYKLSDLNAALETAGATVHPAARDLALDQDRTIAALRAEVAELRERNAQLIAAAERSVADAANREAAIRRPLAERIAEPRSRLSFGAETVFAANDADGNGHDHAGELNGSAPGWPRGQPEPQIGLVADAAAVNDRPWMPSLQTQSLAQSSPSEDHSDPHHTEIGNAAPASGGFMLREDEALIAIAGEGVDAETPRRVRLMDRITGLDKSSG